MCKFHDFYQKIIIFYCFLTIFEDSISLKWSFEAEKYKIKLKNRVFFSQKNTKKVIKVNKMEITPALAYLKEE